MGLKLEKETRERALKSIEQYFAHNFSGNIELPIGGLQAGLLLDFFVEEIAPCVYNQAVSDVQNKLQENIMEIDGYIYQEPFQYWFKKDKKKK